MRIHHFYPRTNNIGDHLVQRGIERMVRRVQAEATFELFDVNSRGRVKADYGLTRRAVDRANSEADLLIVGGSILYEGNYRWHWGVHLEPGALERLRVPLLLLGIGSGSNFNSPLHRPSKRARNEIRLLNDCARLSGARDVTTLEWLHQCGITRAQLTGDPATFIFNEPPRKQLDGHILMVMPPRRFWSSKRQFWTVRRRGRTMFRALVSLAKSLLEEGETVIVVCNDPADLPLAKSLFSGGLPAVLCPKTPEEYFLLLSAARAVVSGRLHTAVVAFSLGVPFALLNADQRTAGFIKTYQLERWSLVPSLDRLAAELRELTTKLLRNELSDQWQLVIDRRDEMYTQSMKLLKEAMS